MKTISSVSFDPRDLSLLYVLAAVGGLVISTHRAGDISLATSAIKLAAEKCSATSDEMMNLILKLDALTKEVRQYLDEPQSHDRWN